MANPPYPNNPPVGTDFATIWSAYRFSVMLGLYVSVPQTCPPPLYEQIVQPSYPGYVLLFAEEWVNSPPEPSPDIASQRFNVFFAQNADAPPTTVNGWFVLSLLQDGSYLVMGAFPFGYGLVLSHAGDAILLNTTMDTSDSGQAVGQSVVSPDYMVIPARGIAMAKVFRREQRAALHTANKALAKILLWDSQLPRPDSYKGVLSRLPMLPNLPPPGIQYLDIANQIIARITADLAATGPV